MSSDIRDPEAQVACLVSDVLTDDQKDFLFEIGLRYPSFVVGWAGEDLVPYVEQVTHEEYKGSPMFAVFNLDQGKHWNPSEWFTSTLLQMPFDTKTWTNAASKMLRKIETGDLGPEYLSEQEPADNPGVVKKIVGTTYKDFVLDPEKDVVMLYKRQNCPHCEKFHPEFTAFAEECEAAGLDFLKFGWIDVSRNSADIKFPYMAGVPHVYIYPAKNKTGGDSLRGGRDRDAIIRWLKKYATGGEIPFDAPPPDKTKVAMELFQMLFAAKNMPPEEQEKAMKFIQEQSELVGIGSENNKTEEVKDEL